MILTFLASADLTSTGGFLGPTVAAVELFTSFPLRPFRTTSTHFSLGRACKVLSLGSGYYLKYPLRKAFSSLLALLLGQLMRQFWFFHPPPAEDELLVLEEVLTTIRAEIISPHEINMDLFSSSNRSFMDSSCGAFVATGG